MIFISYPEYKNSFDLSLKNLTPVKSRRNTIAPFKEFSESRLVTEKKLV